MFDFSLTFRKLIVQYVRLALDCEPQALDERGYEANSDAHCDGDTRRVVRDHNVPPRSAGRVVGSKGGLGSSCGWLLGKVERVCRSSAVQGGLREREQRGWATVRGL